MNGDPSWRGPPQGGLLQAHEVGALLEDLLGQALRPDRKLFWSTWLRMVPAASFNSLKFWACDARGDRSRRGTGCGSSRSPSDSRRPATGPGRRASRPPPSRAGRAIRSPTGIDDRQTGEAGVQEASLDFAYPCERALPLAEKQGTHAHILHRSRGLKPLASGPVLAGVIALRRCQSGTSAAGRTRRSAAAGGRPRARGGSG